jgi:spectrin beta
LQRINEKKAVLGNDLGRDLNSALALLRKHEAFENELVALEAQLQVLVEDASKLQKTYPNNKANIQQQQELVVEAWGVLKEIAELRHDQLQASVDLQKFLTQVRNLTNWANALRLDMKAEENVRNADRAQLLRMEHDALKNEIEAREKDFQDVANNLTAMEQTDTTRQEKPESGTRICSRTREAPHRVAAQEGLPGSVVRSTHVAKRGGVDRRCDKRSRSDSE